MPEARLKREISDPQPEITRNEDQLTTALLLSVLEEVRGAMSARAAIVVVCEPTRVRCVASAVDQEIAGLTVEADSTFTRECLKTGRVVLCEDAEHDARIDLPVVQDLRVHSAVAVPVEVHNTVVGVIEVFSSRSIPIADIAPLEGVSRFLAPILAPELAGSAEPAVGSADLAAQVAEPAVGSTGVAAQVAEPATEEGAADPKTLAPNPTQPNADTPDALVGPTAGELSGPVMGEPVNGGDRFLEGSEVPVRRAREAEGWPPEKKLPARVWFVASLVILFILLALVLAFPRFASNPARTTWGSGVLPASHSEKGKRTGPGTAKAPATVGGPGLGKTGSGSLEVPTAPVAADLPKTDEGKERAIAHGSGDMGALAADPDASKMSGMAVPAASRQFVDLHDSKPIEAGRKNEVASGPSAPSLMEETKRESFEPLKTAEALATVSAAPKPIRSVPEFVLERSVKGHSGWVTGVAFSSESGRLTSGSWDQTVRFWDVSTGQQVNALSDKVKQVQALAISRDGRWLATENSSDTVTLWEAATGKEIRTLPTDKSVGAPGTTWVYSIAFSPDSRWLASGVDNKTVRIWEVSTGRAVRDFMAQRRPVIYVAFSPDGRLLATGDDEKTIGIWDVASGKEIQKLSGHKKAVNAVAFSPNGRWLASASADKTVKLWDIADGPDAHTLIGHESSVSSLSFSPDSRWLASGSWDKTIKIWDVETGREVQSLGAENHPVYSVAFDSCGRLLASGSEDGTINVWRLSGAVGCD
jgi:WD40 repeat protein